MYLSLFVMFYVGLYFGMHYFMLFLVLAIILTRKRELVALLFLSFFRCIVTVIVL